jgi:predicted lipoprotein with Yx(FWY)xxD motif
MKAKFSIMFTIIFVLAFAVTGLAMHHAVKVSSKDGVGRYLSDTEGMTLYWFTKDSARQSSCSGGCLEKWPIFYRHDYAGRRLKADHLP